MSPRDLQACETFQPAEKACWEILLREYPDFKHIDLAALDAAMNKTLRQLWAVLAAGSMEAWLKELDNSPPFATRGDCALNGLLPYFNTGQRALELIVKEFGEAYPELAESERLRMADELSAGFKLLVHWQLQGSCSRCPQAKQCRFGDTRDLPTVLIAASKGRALTSHTTGVRKKTNCRGRAGLRGGKANQLPARTHRPEATQVKNCEHSPAKDSKRAERSKLSAKVR